MHDGAACSFHWPVSAQLLCTWAMFDGVYKGCSCCKTNVPKKDFTPDPKSFCCHGLFCTVKQSVMDVKVLGFFKATFFPLFFNLPLKISPVNTFVQVCSMWQYFATLWSSFLDWKYVSAMKDIFQQLLRGWKSGAAIQRYVFTCAA